MRERVIHYAGIIAIGWIAYHWSGCIAFYGRVPVQMQVVDLETSVPVPDASIVMRAHLGGDLNTPSPENALTDAQGMTRMMLPTYEPGLFWVVTKNGYVARQGLGVIGDKVPDDWNDRPPMLINRREMNVISLMREPEPRGTVIIPKGFQGVIELRPDPSAPLPPVGQREFIVTVNRSGVVLLPARGVAEQIEWKRFIYPDATPVPAGSPMNPGHSGGDRIFLLGWLDPRVYFIGQQPDAQRLYDFVQQRDAQPGESRFGWPDSMRLRQIVDHGLSALPAATPDSTKDH